jgi:hypothetical protein
MKNAIGDRTTRRSRKTTINNGITPKPSVEPIEATLVTAYEADYFKVPFELDV